MNNDFNKDQKELLDQKIIAVVSVLSPNGHPFLTPIWFVEYNNKIYFSTLITRTKGKFLSQNNNIGINITHPNGHPYVSVVGKARIRNKDEFADYKTILALLFDRYMETADKETAMQNNLNNKERILVEIEPSRVFS